MPGGPNKTTYRKRTKSPLSPNLSQNVSTQLQTKNSKTLPVAGTQFESQAQAQAEYSTWRSSGTSNKLSEKLNSRNLSSDPETDPKTKTPLISATKNRKDCCKSIRNPNVTHSILTPFPIHLMFQVNKKMYNCSRQRYICLTLLNVMTAIRDTKNRRHLAMLKNLKIRRAGDVETNPGPADSHTTQPETKLILVTQNCRGLGEEKKVKH